MGSAEAEVDGVGNVEGLAGSEETVVAFGGAPVAVGSVSCSVGGGWLVLWAVEHGTEQLHTHG